ncbi:MAG: PD-(D/E)XK nuclease family protein [Pirellulales bacterium]|nr:PD-(D/E)XK nuclease family protein [Pirellulales bacterium]
MNIETLEKPHLSATQLEMFWRCPEQYRRRYIEGERIQPGVALILGKAFHAGAEVNFRQKIESHEDLPEKEIIDASAAAFDTEVAGGYVLSDEETSVGAEKVLGAAKDKTIQLAGVHASEQAPDYQPVAVEHATRIVFQKASHDLLAITDLRDDKRRVVDLKTAGKKMPSNSADTSTQLTIYAAAFQVDTGVPPAEVRLDVLTKTKIPARQVLVSNRTQADYQALLNRVNATLAAIQAGNFTPCSPGNWVCSPKWCGYWHTCPFINSERLAAAETNGG